jgi:hypothetical protein
MSILNFLTTKRCRRPTAPRTAGPVFGHGVGVLIGAAGSGDVSGEALVLPGASADPLELGPGVRRLLAVFHEAVMEVVEDDGGAGVSGQDRGRAGGDVAGPVALGPGAHEPAAVP